MAYEIGFSLFEQSMAEWPSFPERISGGDGVLVEKLYSILTSEPPHDLHFRVPSLLEGCLIRYPSFDEIYCHPWGSNGKQVRPSMVWLSLLRPCRSVLAQTVEKHSVPGLLL